MTRFEAGSYRESVERSISFLTRDLDLFTEVKADWLVALARRELGGAGQARVLDVGCGAGLTDALLVPSFGEVSGVDIEPDMVAAAARANPGARYQLYDGSTLPFADARFDLVFAINVLHHVAPEQWLALAGEMRRVTRAGGLIAILEHNPWNPLTRRAVKSCPLDDGVTLLRPARLARLLAASGLEGCGGDYLLFFPWRGAWLRRIERALRWLPLGAQYARVGRRR